MRRLLPLSAMALGLLLSTPAHADRLGPQRFAADSLAIQDVIGTVIVTPTPGADTITVTFDATPEELALLSANVVDGTVTVARTKTGEPRIKFWQVEDRDVTIRITVPVGAQVKIDDMIGKVDLGDLDGPLTADVKSALEIKAGRLSHASINIAGAAELDLGDITGKLNLSIAGAGEADIGAVRQGADIRIAGFGDIDVASVRGDVTVRVSGAGSVDLRDGDTPMLDVSVSGIGDVSYDGKAQDQRISTSGLSNVRINGKKV